MWPTFLTAYHFPMKMESLSQAFKAAACTVCMSTAEIQCLLYVTVCKCQDWHVTCLLPRGELIHTRVDWCEFNLSLRHSANTLAVCHLVVLTPSASTPKNGRQTIIMAPQKRNVGMKIKRSTLVFRSTSSSTRTHARARALGGHTRSLWHWWS